MEIVVVGRHTEVADRFRRHVEDKLAKIEQLAPTAQRVDVEVTHENNPRQSGVRERVELTVRDKGPVIRAEAAADDRFGALDLAMTKLSERLRRANDRRKNRFRNPTPEDTADVRPFVPTQVQEPAAPTAPSDPGDTVEIQLGTLRSSSARSSTARPPCRSTTRSTRWRWWGTTSSSSSTSRPLARPWPTAVADGPTA